MTELYIGSGFLLVSLLFLVLRKTYSMVPARELKRQSVQGNQLARELYRAVAFGGSLRLLLAVLTLISSAVGLVLVVAGGPTLTAAGVVFGWLLLAFWWLPVTRLTKPGLQLARQATPPLVWLLRYFDRPLAWTADLIERRVAVPHSGLFETEDVLELLDRQALQPDSRITPEEISLMRHVLRFGNRRVRDIVRPLAKTKLVAATDAVGPILLDELHASGQTSFPVRKAPRSKEIVGTLHIADVGIHSSGTVEEYLTPGVTYVHEADNLSDALHAFYQTRRQLFVVVDSHEETVGVLTLEDILFDLVDRPAIDESLGSHEDRTAVAARHQKPTVVE